LPKIGGKTEVKRGEQGLEGCIRTPLVNEGEEELWGGEILKGCSNYSECEFVLSIADEWRS